MEVQTAPVRYGFAQEVTLYRREAGEVHAPANGTGGWDLLPEEVARRLDRMLACCRLFAAIREGREPIGGCCRASRAFA
jgi:hypothetical protein